MFHERKWVVHSSATFITIERILFFNISPVKSQDNQCLQPLKGGSQSVSWQGLIWNSSTKTTRIGSWAWKVRTISKWVKVCRTRSCLIINSGELKIDETCTEKHEVRYRNKNYRNGTLPISEIHIVYMDIYGPSPNTVALACIFFHRCNHRFWWKARLPFNNWHVWFERSGCKGCKVLDAKDARSRGQSHSGKTGHDLFWWIMSNDISYEMLGHI